MRLMQIDIGVGHVAQSVTELRDVAAATGELAKQTERLARAQGRLGTWQPGPGMAIPVPGPGAATSGGGAGSAVPRATQGAGSSGDRMLPGPYQRLARARENLQKALASGTQEQIDDARIAVERAEKAVERTLPKAPKTLEQRLLETLFTTRFNLPDPLRVLQPLVGRSLDALFPGVHKAVFSGGGQGIMPQRTGAGGGSAGDAVADQIGKAGGKIDQRLSPLWQGVVRGTLAVAGLAAASIATVKAMETLSRRVLEFGNARMTSGGSGSAVAFLAALGMDPGQIAGEAASLRQTLSSNGLAAGAAAQIGVGHVLPRGLGGRAEAQTMQDVMVGLRGVTNEQERYNLAVRMDKEHLLPLIAVSEEVWRRQMRAMELQRRTYDPQTEQRARDFAANMGVLGANLGMLWDRMKRAALGPVAEGVGAVADFIGQLGKDAQAFAPVADLVGEGVGFILTGLAGVGQLIRDHYSNMGSIIKALGQWAVATAKKIPLLRDAIGELGEKGVRVAGGLAQATLGLGMTIGGTMLALSGGTAGIVAGVGAALVGMGFIAKGFKTLQGAQDRQANETSRNTDAVRDLNHTLETGVFGGGERGRGAMPRGWTGYFLAREGEARAMRAGAFAL